MGGSLDFRTPSPCMSSLSSRPQARRETLVFAVCALLVVGYGVFIALASPAGFPTQPEPGVALPYLSDKPVGEDGFYMLTVAWHFAEGRGLVYNYGIPTVGVQPLSTFLYAGAAWLVQQAGGDRWAFVRVVQLLGVLNLLALSLVVGRLAGAAFEMPEQRRAFVAAASLALFSFWLYRAMTYGLETGLYLLLIAGCILVSLRVLSPPRETDAQTGDVVLLGLLAGGAGLARIDFGVILLVLLAASLATRRLRLRDAVVVGAIALAVVLPWLLWVHGATGSWIPSSGRSHSFAITASSAGFRLRELAEAAVDHLTPWIYTGSRSGPTLVAAATLGVGAAVLWRVPVATQRKVRPEWRLALLLWGGALLPLFAIYVTLYGAVHFYARYTAPALVIFLPMIAVLVVQRIGPRCQRWVVAVPALLLLCFGVWAGLSLHSGRVGNTHAITAGFIAERFPPPHAVGSFQSGVVGYFNPNVVNLDGKMDARALEARQEGRLAGYVDSLGLDAVLDWPSHVTAFLPRAYIRTWALCPEHPANDQTMCITRSLRSQPLRP